ncbi:Phosphorelay intermediate protein [Marasmius crinis-equi]|uniref:Phosphorelay intermediate protein n=1 Tax=Marasmius crinis-equi TaxID=585013 RepID=A0ABR3F365_9AGAR
MSLASAVKPNIPPNDRTPTSSRTEHPPPVSPGGDRRDARTVSPESRRPPPAADDADPRAASRSEATSTAQPEAEEEEDEDSAESQNGIIDMAAFGQILDLDEDDTHDFSQEMVIEYFTQAQQTFDDLEKALQDKDLKKLSDLGHFLKGSSATLGVSAVQSICEKIQHYGDLKDPAGGTLTDKDALKKITDLMGSVKKDYTVAETWLRQWYRDHGAAIP